MRAQAERVLRRNWREGLHRDGTPYAFTCPGPPRYRHQWHWDSCFHAIAWTRFDATRAREELRTVLRSGPGNGFLPHTVFWHSPARWRRAPFYATRRAWGDRATESIDPPLLPWAWERVAAACPDDPSFAGEALEELARHLDWLARERDPDGDGLLTIVLPDESGLDDSPKFDPAFGPLAHWRPGYFRLIQRCRREGWRAGRIARAYDEHVEDVWVNVAYAMSLRALARLSGEARFVGRAEVVEAALLERCLDPASGLFFDLAGRWEERVRTSTWSALSPILLDSLPTDARRRIAEEHVLKAGRYRAAFGVPSVSMEEPAFKPGFDLWRTWRGPSWTNATWLLCGALRDLGYVEDAARIAGSLARTALRQGLREYYDPLTGRGLGARDFSWSALVTDLADWATEA